MTKEIFDKAASTWDEKPLRLQLSAAVAAGIKKQVRLDRGMAALEIGCGTGLVTVDMAPLLKSILATDTSDGMLNVLNDKISTLGLANVETQCIDLTAEQFSMAGKMFDLIYSSMTFHHIKHTEKVLARCRELLRPGGILCVADLAEEDGSFHGDMPGVEHFGFNRDTLSHAARECGFAEIRFSTIHVISKEVEGNSRDYPVFLMVAE